MEKKTRERKVPVAWDIKTEEYWTIQNKSGWTIEYPTEEQAVKARDFLDNLNWKVEPFVSNDFEDIHINLISGYLKYPIEEVTGGYGSTPLGFNGYEFKGMIGDFKAIEAECRTSEETYASLIVLTDEKQKQLLDFLNN